MTNGMYQEYNTIIIMTHGCPIFYISVCLPYVICEAGRQVEPHVICEAGRQVEPHVICEADKRVGPHVICEAGRQVEPHVICEAGRQVEPHVICEAGRRVGPGEWHNDCVGGHRLPPSPPPRPRLQFSSPSSPAAASLPCPALPCPAPCSTVVAYCVAAFAPNMDVANALLPTYIGTLLFFAGFLIKLDQIPS